MRMIPGTAARRAVTLVACAAALVPCVAAAAEEVCNRFTWDLTTERSLIASAAAGAPANAAPPLALNMPMNKEAALPKPPGKARQPSLFAGHVTVQIAEPGLYRVTLSGEGWIDAIQGDAEQRSEAFSGAHGCPGLRKSVKFRLEPGPLLIQISNSAEAAVTVAVTPDR